jgi:hypothetical protein
VDFGNEVIKTVFGMDCSLTMNVCCTSRVVDLSRSTSGLKEYSGKTMIELFSDGESLLLLEKGLRLAEG